MERKIILASHGNFASGILNSLKLIYGDIPCTEALDCYLTEDFDLKGTVKALMEENQNNEMIIITDILGGSVNNEFFYYIENANFYLVAGLNLPLLIELISKLESMDSIPAAISQAIQNSKDSIQFCNPLISQKVTEDNF